MLRGLPRLSKDGLDVEAAGEGDADIAERFEKLVARPQAIELEAREDVAQHRPQRLRRPISRLGQTMDHDRELRVAKVLYQSADELGAGLESLLDPHPRFVDRLEAFEGIGVVWLWTEQGLELSVRVCNADDDRLAHESESGRSRGAMTSF